MFHFETSVDALIFPAVSDMLISATIIQEGKIIMSITRILGIAPYKSMQNLMEQLAAGMEGVALTAFIGDLEPGAKIAERYTNHDFDVILSRGGTAELIRHKTSLPVVNIELSMYDILRAIRLAEGSNCRYAIVGFPAITHNARVLCDMLNLNVEIHTIYHKNDAHSVLEKLANADCPMVLCDMVTNSLAHEYGIPALLITSGSESVEAALHQAVSIGQIFLAQKERAQMLKAAMCATVQKIIIMDENGYEVFSTIQEDLPATVRNRLQFCHQATLKEGSRRTIVTVQKQQYILNCQLVTTLRQCYVSIIIQISNTHIALEKHGIRFVDKEEVLDHSINSFYGTTQLNALPLYDRYSVSAAALMLVGENGSGAEQIARLIYSRSPCNTPLCIIDCALLQKKGWDYLTDSDTSPLTDIGITVNFIHIEELKEEWFIQLFHTIQETNFKERNRLIFCCTLQGSKGLSPRCLKLIDWFSCTVVELPPLRSHREDIPHLASLYLSLLNMREAREIAGLEPEALRLLENYTWPANYDQFQRILQELVLLTKTPYITADTVRHTLQREERMYPSQASGQLADILRGKTLEEVDRIAMNFALSECNGNQRVAALRLGISRTTLWRMLQQEDPTK